MIEPCCYWCGLSYYKENGELDCEIREVLAKKFNCKPNEVIVESDSACIYGHYCFYPNKLYCEVME